MERLKRTRMGKISRRPMIMHRAMTSLDRPDSAEKLQAGPTASRPGPTLLTLVRADVKATEKETLSREMKKEH